MRFEALALARATWTERLERLRFQFGKWDLNVAGRATVPPGALVLSAAEHQEASAAAEALAAANLAAQHRWIASGEGPRLPGFADALARAGPPGPFVTRVDLFLTRDGWRASEANDDVPGGYNEAIGLPLVLWDALPDGLAVPGDLPDALASLVGAEPGARIGIVYATGYAEDLQVVHLLERLWTSAGAVVVLAGPGSLAVDSQGALLDGKRVDRIFRFFPVEWHADLPNVAAWLEAARRGLVTNPFACGLTQDKSSFAWSDARYLVPRTVLLDDETAKGALSEPQRWLLKPRFGRMGEGVDAGAWMPREAWRKRIEGALRSKAVPFVLQERFDPLPVEVGPGEARTACLGAYVVAGRFAGYYSRLAAGPVVAYDAANALTLVESP